MKWFIGLGLLFTQVVMAQVNLDQPITTGRSDKLFISTEDPTVAYYFPVALVRQNDAVFLDRDQNSAVATFNASFSPTDLSRVTQELLNSDHAKMKIRLFRPLSYQVEPGVDISPYFRPSITIMNDLNFDGSTQFSLIVDSRHRLFRKKSTGLELFNTLFGDTDADNVAIIRYEMAAQSLGQPVRLRTAVSVLVGKARSSNAVRAQESTGFMVGGNAPVIMEDSMTGCWNRVEVGQFCIKKVEN